MAESYTDPYYYQSRLRELSGQRALTTGRGLTKEEIEAVLSSELGERYTAQQRGRALKMQERALDIQEEAAKETAEAARLSGYTELAIGATYLGSKAYPYVKDWVAPATTTAAGGGTALDTVSTIALPAGSTAPVGYEAVASGVGGEVLYAPTETTGLGVGGVAVSAGAGYLGGEAGEWIVRQTPIEKLTPWGGEKTEETTGRVAGGAAAGFAVSGPVGALIGGGIALVTADTIICSELSRQGLLDPEILRLDGIHRKTHIDDDTYYGYIMWAKYVVRVMRRSKLFTHLIAPIVQSWATEMASRIDNRYKGNITGKILITIGVPISRLIGRVRRWQISLPA